MITKVNVELRNLEIINLEMIEIIIQINKEERKDRYKSLFN